MNPDHEPSPEPPTAAEQTPLLRALLDAVLGRGEEVDLARAPPGLEIWLLAVPMALEMSMESVFALCDALFVGQLGDGALATVGLTESMLTLVYAVAVGLSMGITALVARRVGAGDRQGAVRAAAQGIYVATAFGLVSGIACWIAAPHLLAAMGADPEVVEIGGSYCAIVLGTQVVVMLLFAHNAVFRGAGDAARAMHALWLANAINLVLDPCLIFGLGPFPELGLTGAAIATAIGRGVGVLFQLRILLAGRSRVVLRGPNARPVLVEMRELARVSVGGISQFLIATASWVVLMKIVAPFGQAAVAGYTIAIRIVMFTILPSWGLSNAAATLVGQGLGAGDPERAVRATWQTGFHNMLFLGAVMVVFILFGDGLVAPFSEDPATRAIAADALRILSYGYLAYGWGMVMVQAFNGAGLTRIPTWINLGVFWALEIPLAWWLAGPMEFGPAGVFWAVAISESMLAVVALLVFRAVDWRNHVGAAVPGGAQVERATGAVAEP